MLRRLICAAAAMLALLCATAIAGAADYPERPVTIVVGFPPGGASDILARIMADKLGSVLGKPFVVDNRPGAGGNVAGEVVAHAAADGYTLLQASVSNGIIAATLPNLRGLRRETVSCRS